MILTEIAALLKESEPVFELITKTIEVLLGLFFAREAYRTTERYKDAKSEDQLTRMTIMFWGQVILAAVVLS